MIKIFCHHLRHNKRFAKKAEKWGKTVAKKIKLKQIKYNDTINLLYQRLQNDMNRVS